MRIFNLSIRALVFGSALLLGTTAVVASHFVIGTITNVITPAVINARTVSHVEPGPFLEFDVSDKTINQGFSDDFDPSGNYSLDIENVPKAFADIEYLDITTREYINENGTHINRPIVPAGMIMTKKSLTFTKLALGNHEISFETESVGGISYQFVGQFHNPTETINCESCEYPADLKGNLRKIKNGQVIAELEAKFYINGC